MTKARIKEITAESARLVAEKRAGVTPLDNRFKARADELRRRRRAASSGTGPHVASYVMCRSDRD